MSKGMLQLNPKRGLWIAALAALVMTGCSQTGADASEAEAKTEQNAAKTDNGSIFGSLFESSKEVTVPAGTVVKIRTGASVSSKTNASGNTIPGTLVSAITVGDEVIAPAGADATLLVSAIDEGGRVKGRASLGMKLQSLELGGDDHNVSSSTFWREAPGTKKKDAATVGILSGIGAAVGAIADGGKGAAIGAASGAGAGSAVVLSTRGAAAEVPAETVITFTLTAPVKVTI